MNASIETRLAEGLARSGALEQLEAQDAKHRAAMAAAAKVRARRDELAGRLARAKAEHARWPEHARARAKALVEGGDLPPDRDAVLRAEVRGLERDVAVLDEAVRDAERDVERSRPSVDFREQVWPLVAEEIEAAIEGLLPVLQAWDRLDRLIAPAAGMKHPRLPTGVRVERVGPSAFKELGYKLALFEHAHPEGSNADWLARVVDLARELNEAEQAAE